MVGFVESIALARETDAERRLALAAQQLSAAVELGAIAVTFAPNKATKPHRIVYAQGYCPDNLEYLRSTLVTNDPNYRALVNTRSPVLGWDNGPDFSVSLFAQRWLIPAGFHDGASLCVRDANGAEIGSVHVNTAKKGWSAMRGNALFAFHGLVTDLLSRQREWEDLRLTPREVSIATLIAEGASNPRIAQQLWLSTSTVRTHVENIMRKLGVGSRVAIAVVAAKHGLI